MGRSDCRDFGNRNEELAARYLEGAGFVIFERNFYARKLGEIDIIAQKGGVLHFIEVKSAAAEFDPIYNLTPTKLQRVIRSAQYYLKSKGLDLPYCIDALLIRRGKVELIENVTL